MNHKIEIRGGVLRAHIIDSIVKGAMRVGWKVVDEKNFVFKGLEHLGVLNVKKPGADHPLEFKWLDAEIVDPVWQ